MSALQRSTSPPNPTTLSVPEDERILEEDRSAGGSDGSAFLRASADAPTSAAPASQPSERIDIENEAASSYPQQTSTSHHNVPRRPARREPFFGIPQPSGAPANFRPNYDDDYETRFPPDPIYEEASENARVYRVYMEESAKHDAYMTDEAREGLDVNLVFAGLFSAVLTTFIAQTSQSLQPDRATESTLLLREIAALQRAQINGTSIASIPSTPSDFTPSAIDIWVNALWFTSLMLSLASALFAVLIKQWIRHYMSLTSGTPKERSLIHQFRFMGLEKWHVPTLIGILPVLMHISLALFFAGLTLFLIPLRPFIASIVGSLSTLIFVAYITTAAWPLFHIQCPYHSPLSTMLHDITFTVREYLLWRHQKYVFLKEQERQAAQSDNAFVVPAFEWLLNMSLNPSVDRVVVQAVAGLRKSSSIETLTNNWIFQCVLVIMFKESISLSADGTCILPEKVDLLARLMCIALHLPRRSTSFAWSLCGSDVCTAIQSFHAPTLQWEAVTTALLWHHRVITNEGNFENTALAQKAHAVVGRLISDPHEKETRLPPIVWEDLLAAASLCPGILFPGPSDRPLQKKITNELAMRVCFGLQHVATYKTLSISFEEALYGENFVWCLLLPFDKYRGNPLDSEKVQRLLSLVYAIVSHGLREVSRNLFIGTCKELICELQAGSVTLNDQEAVCGAMDALLQKNITFQDDCELFAVLLPSLLFLHCWKPHIPLRHTKTDILLNLIKINMINMLHNLYAIENWLWNRSSSVKYLIASLIRTSFELRTDPGAQPEDSRWLEYLSLPKNSTTIVALFTFQGTTDTPASVAQVRHDLLLFFSSQSLDCDTLQKCKSSLESNLKDFVDPDWGDAYTDNIQEARKVIDKLISKQSPKPAYQPRRLLRRSRTSPDPEARHPQVELSSLNTANTSSG